VYAKTFRTAIALALLAIEVSEFFLRFEPKLLVVGNGMDVGILNGCGFGFALVASHCRLPFYLEDLLEFLQ
jgi:hypothetical protein